MDLSSVAERVAGSLGLRDVESIGGGLEFAVFRAGQVALRIPRERVYRTPGEIPSPAVRLQHQEFALYQRLAEAGLPVPRPVRLVDESGIPVLAAEFISSDGAAPRPDRLGRFLAALHGLPIGNLDLVTHEHTQPVLALAARLSRRWVFVREHVDDLPGLPSQRELARLLGELATGPTSLLHLDVRACNLLSRAGELHAVVDWSSAMITHPVLEFARMREYEHLPENGIDLAAITAEYRRHLPIPTVDPVAEAILRLDAMSMLALVFLDYSPDPDRAAWAIDRVRELIDVTTRRSVHE